MTTARFTRVHTRHRFTAREATVTAVSRPVPQFVRVTLAGPELYDFVSIGPTDHVKVYFPHPFTGEHHAPSPLGADADGITQPDAQTFGRMFTPTNVRTDAVSGLPIFDLDFFLHDDPGPASAWAARADLGDRLVVVGPRGSRGVPAEVSQLVCMVDPTALPATARWVLEMPRDTEIEIVADVPYEALEWVESYLRNTTGRDLSVREALGGLDQAMRDTELGGSGFLFAAGDAARLVPLRRVLRDELGVPSEQYQISGYWRRGEANFDHHAPLDPSDPDD